MKKRSVLSVLLILILVVAYPAGAQEGEIETLSFPAMTLTDCQWNENGDLIGETAHTLDGEPAVNSRGFCRAEYGRDGYGNLISEAYYGLSGELVAADGGYARADYTYYTDNNGNSHIVTEIGRAHV